MRVRREWGRERKRITQILGIFRAWKEILGRSGLPVFHNRGKECEEISLILTPPAVLRVAQHSWRVLTLGLPCSCSEVLPEAGDIWTVSSCAS